MAGQRTSDKKKTRHLSSEQLEKTTFGRGFAKKGYVSEAEQEEYADMLSESDKQLIEEIERERKIKIITAISALVVAAIVVVVYFAATGTDKGKSASAKLADTYMSGLENADVDKVKSVMDPDTVDDESINTLIEIFQTYSKNGIQYTLEYTVGESYEASSTIIESVSSALYNKSAANAGIKKGYIVPVKGTMMLTYGEQSSPYDLNLDIICYEKDGEWFLGGTLDKESSGESSDEPADGSSDGSSETESSK